MARDYRPLTTTGTVTPCDLPRFDDGEYLWTLHLDEQHHWNGEWDRVRVVRSFSKWGTTFGDYPELYEVEYNDGTRREFLPHALRHHPGRQSEEPKDGE